MLEYEKKIMLTEDEYYSIILSMRKHITIQTQINYYFDNDDLSMNEKGITCRIRSKNGTYKATVKKHNAEHSDCSIEVDLVEKTDFDPKIFNVLGLHHQGKLVTERIVMHKDSACEMVLDRNVYLGHTDFELEVEYCKESEARAETLIKNVAECLIKNKHFTGIDEFTARVGQGNSKSQRFFECLKNQKQ